MSSWTTTPPVGRVAPSPMKDPPMTPDRLIAKHPVLFHMADARNWASIERFGLLSTTALLDRYAILGPERFAVESNHRPTIVPITHPELGPAYVRDQGPLDPDVLPTCLTDLTPQAWLETLNGRVFFWPTEDRLARMLKAYLKSEQAVFEVDTRRFLDRYADRVELSHINSGFAAAAYKPAPRGSTTFQPLANYADTSKNAIAEVTVPGGVPDIFDLTVRVVGRGRGRDDRLIWGQPLA